ELTLATAAPGPPGEEMHTREGALREPDVCFSPREEAPGPSCARLARNVNLYWAVLPASRRAQRSPCPDAPGRGPHRLATNQPVRRSHIGTERSQRPGSPTEASSYGRPRRRPSALWSALSAWGSSHTLLLGLSGAPTEWVNGPQFAPLGYGRPAEQGSPGGPTIGTIASLGRSARVDLGVPGGPIRRLIAVRDMTNGESPLLHSSAPLSPSFLEARCLI